MIPEHIIQKLKTKQGHYSIDVKESFIDKQRRLSEIERQTTLQKKHKEMQLFRQTFSSSSSTLSKPGKRIMIRTKGSSNQAIPLEQYQQSIPTPIPTPTSNIARKHHQSQSQQLPRLESESNQTLRKQPEHHMNTQHDMLNQLEPQDQNMLTEQIDPMQMQLSEENNNDHIQCMVEQHLSDYQAFVMHLAGKCICVQCPCGKCKCKFEYQPIKPNISWKSHYNQEFKQAPIKDQELKMNLDSIGRYQSLDLNEFKTTMASDYKQFDAFPNTIKEKQKYQATYGSTPMTSYNKFYMDYGDLHHEQFKQSHYKTVIPELKFNSSTTYGSEFRSPKQADTTSQKPPNGRPFPTIDLFLGQSQNKLAHDLKMTEKCYQVKNFQEPIQTIPAFEKQFVSTTKKDFVMKEVPCIRNQYSQQIQQQY
ncbi:unnamed protein product (macronuclear) [Paramecium tetraurelia]|uniref:STOP protein n=1 Tax=Paramecium tetraurelia TaxID=5888 RepID=A0C0X6_PARTE|nr:uncharacterized protein GSPATT00033919001 [Paramecium tetraurelia]CAK64443.1 unnamed protein product [Paramecium tetraurelia]|eukprot:XP_001431841.1 hypothetical protein (macronuclear) [Paramecium tetraurelia strain d4-2]